MEEVFIYPPSELLKSLFGKQGARSFQNPSSFLEEGIGE